MNKDTLCDDLQKLNDEEVQSFFIQDAVTRIRQQQSRILELEGCINDCYTVQKMQADELYKGNAEIEALKKKIQNMALDLLSAHAQADDHWVELERLRKAQEK